MQNKKIKIIQTRTYLNSLDNLKDNNLRIAVERKVNKLLDNQSIAEPMSYQHEGFCEIKIGSQYRVYCIKIEDTLVIAFILGPVVNHSDNYRKSKEYLKLFDKLKEIKEEFKNKI